MGARFRSRTVRLLGRLGGAVLVVIIGFNLAAALPTGGDRPRPPARADQVPTPAPTTSRPAATSSSSSAPTSRPRVPAAPPRAIRVPAIGVDAEVIPLGTHPDGTLETPADFAQTGWWSGGYAPGGSGPAVIVGHVDNKEGPAVFYDLPELVAGDSVEVEAADGVRRRFVVERVAQYRKVAFPTEEVYGRTERPSLRLVTCGGAFDRGTGHYVDNVVVYAELVP